MKSPSPASPPPPTIFWAKQVHVPRLVYLSRTAGTEDFFDESYWLRLVAAKQSGAFLLSLGDADPVAYVAFETRSGYNRILDLVTHPGARRHGLGTLLVNRLKAPMGPRTRNTLYVSVRESNLPAQLFFKACGFRWEETKKAGFKSPPEDGYQMIWKRDAEEK